MEEILKKNRNWITRMRPLLWSYAHVNGDQKIDMFSNRWEFRLEEGTIKVYHDDRDFIDKSKKYLKELGIPSEEHESKWYDLPKTTD